MKRIPRDPEKFEVISLFDAIGQRRGLKLNEKESEKTFLDSVSKSLTQSKDVPIILHGRRVEAMFGYVAGSLGRSTLIKREDSGDIYAVDTNLRCPDYHLLLDDGTELFVEVKNCHKTNPSYNCSIKGSYLDALSNYAQLFKRGLKVAIYWSKWNAWTLLSPDRLRKQENLYMVTFSEAMKMNEMATLGDILVGTRPPLLLRVVTDPDKPRTIASDGNVLFTIAGVELYCNPALIESKLEQIIALYLMLYGDWPANGPRAVIENNDLLAIEFIAAPLEPTPGQGFEFIGRLSGMIWRQYNYLTAPTGQIDKLSPSEEPGALGILIPKEYKGNQLPLWRFIQQPNYDL